LPYEVIKWMSPPRPRNPNEATHAASLALSLGIYERWPQGYRTHWHLAHALSGYGWMLRGSEFWRDVPRIGKEGFPIFMEWSEQFYESTLEMNADADGAWYGLIKSTGLSSGDWLDVFDRAVEANPHDYWVYEAAMGNAMDRWGGDAETRQRIESKAIENNPDAEWAKKLRNRWETWEKTLK